MSYNDSNSQIEINSHFVGPNISGQYRLKISSLRIALTHLGSMGRPSSAQIISIEAVGKMQASTTNDFCADSICTIERGTEDLPRVLDR